MKTLGFLILTLALIAVTVTATPLEEGRATVQGFPVKQYTTLKPTIQNGIRKDWSPPKKTETAFPPFATKRPLTSPTIRRGQSVVRPKDRAETTKHGDLHKGQGVRPIPGAPGRTHSTKRPVSWPYRTPKPHTGSYTTKRTHTTRPHATVRPNQDHRIQ